MQVNRRTFIGSTLGVTAIWAMTQPAAAYPARAPVAAASAYTLYDSRFPEAFKRASALADDRELHAIGGDVTEFATCLYQHARAGVPLDITGITTESVPFCLHQMAHPALRSDLAIERVDRDLFSWRLRVWQR